LSVKLRPFIVVVLYCQLDQGLSLSVEPKSFIIVECYCQLNQDNSLYVAFSSV